MNSFRKLVKKINDNVILRNLVLAVSAVLVLIALSSIMLSVFTRHGQERPVPAFGGMNVEEAMRSARHASVEAVIVDSLYVPAMPGGVVLEQSPSPGAKVKSGRKVFLTINASSQREAVIPYVAGYSLRQAKNNLEVAGFIIDKLVYQSDMATNNVLSQSYKGKPIEPGSKVKGTVGSGVTLVVGYSEEHSSGAIPRAVGFPLGEARSRLWEAGFNVGKVTYDDGVNALNEKDARVYAQSPHPMSLHTLGTPVMLYLTLDEKKVAKGKKESEAMVRKAAAAIADSLKAAARE